MAIELIIDTVGGSNFAGYSLRNVGTLHVGGSALASQATLDVTGDAYASTGYKMGNNVTLRGRNAAGTAWVDIIKLNGSNIIQMPTAVQMDSTFAVTGLATFNAGVVVTGGAGGAGHISKGGTNGLTIYGVTGSSYDFALYDPTGATRIAGVPTGQTGFAFLTPLALASTLTVTGVATFSTGIQSKGVTTGTGKSAEVNYLGSVAYFQGYDRDAAGYIETHLRGNPIAFSDGVMRGLMTGGIFTWGTTVTTGAAAGDVVLANTKSLRSVNAAGTGTAPMISMDSNNFVKLGGGISGAGYVHIPGTSAMPGVGNNGLLLIDTANNRLCYYVNNQRFYLAGAAF